MRETVDSDIPQLVAMWNIVRYSRKYSKLNNTWSSTTSFAGLPETNRCRRRFAANNLAHFVKGFSPNTTVSFEISIR